MMDSNVRDGLITLYFSLGLRYKDILYILAQKHGTIMSERHLKRVLKTLQLSRRKEYTDINDVLAFIQNQLRDSGMLHGYRWMYQKCIEAGIKVIIKVIYVVRDEVLDGGMRCFKKGRFNERALLNVRFMGEDGYDSGGPMREFMQLATIEISKLMIFDGPETARMLNLDYSSLEKGHYKIAGQMLAYFLVHRGPQPRFFHGFLVDMLVHGVDVMEPAIKHIVDLEMQENIQKLEQAQDTDAFHRATAALMEVISLAGCLPLVAGGMSSKDRLIKALCQFTVVDRIRPALAQFREGLSCLGVLGALENNPESMREAFLYKPSSLTSAEITNLYEVKSWSPAGSNKFRKEQRTISYWRDFVEELEDEGRLQELLRSLTGLEDLPPLGFERSPELIFGHDLEHNDPTAEFPYINTCGLVVRLPILPSYDIFKNRFLAAMSIQTFTAN